MGTITNTIGSAGGRDFSTIALWEASLPANTVTAGNSYIGQCFADSEFLVNGNVVTITGITTDSTHTITLTTGAGQSFRDNANAQTNALRYNAVNGVALRNSGDNTNSTVVVQNNDVFVRNLQIQFDGAVSGYGTGIALILGAQSGYLANPPHLDNCIVSLNQTAAHGGVTGAGSGSAGFIMTNSLFIHGGGNYSRHVIDCGSQGCTIVNCTLVVPSDRQSGFASQTGFAGTVNSYHGAQTIKNCVVIGTQSGFSLGSFPVGSNNATDKVSISFGTSNQTSLVGSNQFPNLTFAAGDWKIKAGANLIDAGVTDTTDIPSAIDIVGTSRPQGSAWDIGAWELQAADVLMPQIWM